MSVENNAPRNVYENADGQLDVERERLRTFDAPTKASIAALETLTPGSSFLDIGSGENPGLREYVDQSAGYVAFDVRHEALVDQSSNGASAVEGDAKHLPFANEALDITHARFVLAHFPVDARRQLVSETLRVLKPGGRSLFIDYDWTAMNGSEAVNQIRDFTLQNITLFDASYGSKSKEEIESFVDGNLKVSENRMTPPKMADYGPILSIRQITLAGLDRQQSDPVLKQQAEAIFDALEAEAASDNPPGYHMPDMVAITVQKP